ncbi:MAG: hypothetical protein RIQ78_637 [Bacteroidota bacterium]
MEAIALLGPTSRKLSGTLVLAGSKSISNRALIAFALAKANPADWLSNLSISEDTQTLQSLLSHRGDVFDAGDGGTTFRFMAAYLAIQPGVQTLTGSARMLERPIRPLVEALRSLGANVQYLGEEGFPPLLLGEPVVSADEVPRIRIAADVSSQFLSALLLIAPYLPQGLELLPEGPLVSRSYVAMTVGMMRYFGAEVRWEGEKIHVLPGGYIPRALSIEADWSGASYWYAMAVFADTVDLRLVGFRADSWQGDAVLVGMMERLGIESHFESNTLVLKKNEKKPEPFFEWDFLECPDIAQTLAVVCGGLGVLGVFSGLETLHNKETDRIAALKVELGKVGVSFVKLPAHMNKRSPGKTFYQVQGKATWDTPPVFATHGDHRMAMSFAALSMLGPVVVECPRVVSKSYPLFWEHLRQVGGGVEKMA